MFYDLMNKSLIYLDRMKRLWYEDHSKKNMIQNVPCQQLSMERIVLKFEDAVLGMMLGTFSLLMVI